MKKYIVIFVLLALAGIAMGYFRNETIGSKNFATGDQANKVPSQYVQVFLTRPLNEEEPEDHAVGCGDGLIALTQEVPGDIASPEAALRKLLSITKSKIDTYDNTLAQSDLAFEALRYTDNKTKMIVDLRGELVLSGVCDGPRVKAQLEETARQQPEVREVIILLNGIPLENHLLQQ